MEVPYDATTPAMRKRVKSLIIEAKEACRRPLFEEIANGLTLATPFEDLSSVSKRVKLTKSPNWEGILSEGSNLLPFMTPKEHGILSKCAAIYLLGFFNPHSTGCEFAVLRSTASSDPNAFFDMELEERLENTSRFFQADEFGEVDVCSDVNRERAFQSFLKNGIAPLLTGRPAHIDQSDILHLIAMAISPQLGTEAIDNVVAPFEDKKIPAWVRTKRLMGSLYPHSFSIHYAHRFLLVEIVATQLVLPKTDSPPILSGAVPHLLAAMHTFAAHTAHTVADAHVAHEGMVRIATQIGREWIVREVFYILLAQTLEDRNRCKCPAVFCPHAARGSLLRDCITTFNVSRHYADPTFTGQAFMALNASIEEQMEPWLKDSTDEPQGACLLNSLLKAAEPLFFFMREGDDVDKTGLLEMAIQLLHHPDNKVRQSASSLLSVAFAYMPSNETDKLMVPVLGTIKAAFDDQFKVDASTSLDQTLQKVISVSARNSQGFASGLLSHLLQQRRDNWKSEDNVVDATIADHLTRLVSSISCANPKAAFQQAESIIHLLKQETSENAQGQLVASLLATRQAYFFGKNNDATQAAIDVFLSERKNDRWRNFLTARHALATGNFAVAKSLYDALISHTSSEDSFLWITALSKVAEGESHLLKDGTKGIPQACTLIHAAIAYLESLESRRNERFIFQTVFLRLRLDFLDIAAATRLICREIRLSGTIPRDTTRVGLHLVNTLRSWGALATRYQSLYKRYGLFLCFQSRTAIRTMHSICRKLGNIGMQILSEVVTSKNKADTQVVGPKGDRMHPTTILLQRAHDAVLPSMDKFVEPTVRATTFIELLDGVHRSPMPFPRSFTHSIALPKATLRISFDPSELHLPFGQEDVSMDGLRNIVDAAAIYPGTNLRLIASGSIPKSIFAVASSRLSQLLLWTSIRFVAPLPDVYIVDDDNEDTARQPDPRYTGRTQNAGPLEIQQLSFSNRFVVPFELQKIKSVGIYRVDCCLGCRDIEGVEWELPGDPAGSTILLRVTRRLDQIS